MKIGQRFRPPTSGNSVLEKKQEPCAHNRLDLYVNPCLICGRFCNCNLRTKYPDVIVCSLDRETVHLKSIVVRGSLTLQRLLLKKQKKMNKFVPLITLDYEEDFASVEDEIEIVEEVGFQQTPTGIEINMEVDEVGNSEQQLEFFDNNTEVVDLREGRKMDIPTLGITAKTLLLVQKFMSLHLQQIDTAVEKEYRNKDRFESCLLPQRRKATVNHFGFEDWEEEFFNVDHLTMFDIVQAKTELLMWDLHLATEKWFHLFRGQPAVEKFGQGLYLKRSHKSKLRDGSGCEDFVNKKVFNQHRHSRHCRPTRYYTKVRGFVFPRKTKTGRSIPSRRSN